MILQSPVVVSLSQCGHYGGTVISLWPNKNQIPVTSFTELSILKNFFCCSSVVRLKFLGTVASKRPTIPSIITDYDILERRKYSFQRKSHLSNILSFTNPVCIILGMNLHPSSNKSSPIHLSYVRPLYCLG